MSSSDGCNQQFIIFFLCFSDHEGNLDDGKAVFSHPDLSSYSLVLVSLSRGPVPVVQKESLHICVKRLHVSFRNW
jgi:hypothetical protein